MNENPCGHADHEYNPYAERHECCDSRYCRCTCDGAKEREERYAKWKANPSIIVGEYSDFIEPFSETVRIREVLAKEKEKG